jgi:hypothetical protein
MTRQRLRYSIVMVSLILFAAFAILVFGTLSAEKVSAQGKCTLKTIQGTYIFEAQGTAVKDGKVVPYAEAGVWTLDGEGKAMGIISASMDGVPFATRDTFTATYELKADCVYAVVDAFGLKVDLYPTSSGNTMTYFSPGFSGTQIKQ